MWTKQSSILDYQKDNLSPDIWLPDQSIKTGIRNYILSAIEAFFESQNFKGTKAFIKDILIGSSIATYFYTEDSDIDIKILMDVEEFQTHNPEYADSTTDDVLDELIEMGRSSVWLTAILPGTTHPIDAYFIDMNDFDEESFVRYDSLYSLISNEWLKPPKKMEGELSPSYVLNYAKDIAQKYIDKISADIDKVKRDSIDFIMLRDYMKSLDDDELKQLYVDFKTALENVNKSVEMLVYDKDVVQQLRKQVFSKKELKNDLEHMMGSLNFSDHNLVFKVIQRYGYMRILYEVSQLFKNRKINPRDVDTLLEIVS